MAKEQSLGPNVAPHSAPEEAVRVRRGRVESVDLYEVKDSELELFEKGSPADLQLNFAIFLLSISVSAAFSIATATFSNPKVEMAFYVVTFCGFAIGIFLLIGWWRNHTSLIEVCKQIRARIRPDGVAPDSKFDEQQPIPPAPKG